MHKQSDVKERGSNASIALVADIHFSTKPEDSLGALLGSRLLGALTPEVCD